MMQQAPGYAHPPRPQILEPGEPPEEEIKGTLGAQGLQAWPSRESWQRAGKILATFRVPSCSAQPLRVRVCKTDKTREASFKNFLSETAQSSKMVSLLGQDNATGEGPEGDYSLRLCKLPAPWKSEARLSTTWASSSFRGSVWAEEPTSPGLGLPVNFCHVQYLQPP